jgi:putative membrane protein
MFPGRTGLAQGGKAAQSRAMHLGRKYSFPQFVGWTGWEAVLLIAWSAIVTAFLQFSPWPYLTIPAAVLTIVGSALAIILGFKNAQCYARFSEALSLSGQLISNSLILANRLTSMLGHLEVVRSSGGLQPLFYRHLAWLTSLRFFLRAPKPWENAGERGNARYLADNPPPESGSALDKELNAYLPGAELRELLAYRGDRESLLLRSQYRAVTEFYHEKVISEYVLMTLTGALDDLARVQGQLKRIKNYPYARNFYSIAIFLIWIFVAILPFGLYPYAEELGKAAGIAHCTAWLNVPFSAVVGWIFISLEKVGENSSNPFEGGSNDVPISSIARRIEIELRDMLGEDSGLAPIEAKNDILF